MRKIDFSDLQLYRSQPREEDQRYNCPLCGDTRGKLYVSWKKKVYHCFHCGQGGRVPDETQKPSSYLQAEGEIRKSLHSNFIECTTAPTIRGTAERYLIDHNIDPKLAYTYGVRSGTKDMQGRVVFPSRYRNQSGIHTVFRSAHATTPDTKPKSLGFGDRAPAWFTTTTPPTPHYTTAKDWKPWTAILVEGPADALRIATYLKITIKKWIPHIAAICLFGKTIKEEEAYHLSRLRSDFLICLDRDEQVASLKIQSALDVFAEGEVKIFDYTQGCYSSVDPASMRDSEVKALLKEIPE